MTPRQAQVLKIVSEFWSEQGYAPSMREIAIKMEPPLKSVNSVRDIVVRLCEKNILKKDIGRQNTIRPASLDISKMNNF